MLGGGERHNAACRLSKFVCVPQEAEEVGFQARMIGWEVGGRVVGSLEYAETMHVAA